MLCTGIGCRSTHSVQDMVWPVVSKPASTIESWYIVPVALYIN